MKRKGRHPDKALTAVTVRQAKIPGRYADGNGLYLEVDQSGAKRWTLRIMVRGRRRDIGLGGAALVSLGEAREKALTYRKIAREGGDPLLEKRKAQGTVPTFAEAAEKVHAEHAPSWKNGKHAAQWLTTLKTYAYPEIGKVAIDAIDTPMLLRVLSPIWLAKPETARRLFSGMLPIL
ncbi:Arm DNA-binding domain-containing protein [Xanthobacter flavus]|uniref:tyrosine-type recombinase/integrase n=1 Tax=Xanthobacter flavus TaxID=281 RepID=UPI00372CBEA1